MPQQPPHQPPKLPLNHQYPTVHNHPPSNLPDFLLTAISFILFVTAPKHHLSPRNPQPLSISFPPSHRRLITTTMSQNPRNPNFSSSHFPNPKSLSDWLKPRLPSDSFSTWGVSPGTKNLHNLWLELADGEISLVDSIPPVRNLEVVCVQVRRSDDNDTNRVLIESHQELSDGSIRKRGRPLSEKMKAGEDLESATKRAIREELGVSDDVVKVVMDSYEKKVDERVSVSYPGLPACYVLHYVDAFVDGLPEGEFVTEEGEEYGEEGSDHGVASAAVKVRKHFWKWVPDDSL